MFSVNYKTKLKNKLKNKTQKLVTFSSSSSLHQQLSLPPHLSPDYSSNSALAPYLHPTALSLSPHLSRSTLSRCVGCCTPSLQPLLLHLGHCRCSVSAQPLVLRLDRLDCCCSLGSVSCWSPQAIPRLSYYL